MKELHINFDVSALLKHRVLRYEERRNDYGLVIRREPVNAEDPKWVVMRVLQTCQPWHHGITGFMKKDNGTGIRLMPRDVAVWLAIVERMDSTVRTGKQKWRGRHVPKASK